jgi:hypothetical protein
MAVLEHLQKDFSGGEVGPRVFMRDDLAMHQKSVLIMENMFPSPQGTAIRTPGSRYIDIDVGASTARIFPYMTPSNQHTAVLITPTTYLGDGTTLDVPGKARILSGLTDLGTEGRAMSLAQVNALAPVPIAVQAKENSNFSEGFSKWIATPLEYTSPYDSATLGWEDRPAGPMITLRDHRTKPLDPTEAVLKGSLILPSDTLWLKTDIDMTYRENFSGPDRGTKVVFRVGTAEGAGNIWTQQWIGDVGETYTNIETHVPVGGLTEGTEIFISMTFEAIRGTEYDSTPNWQIRRFALWTQDIAEIGDDTVFGYPPWTADQLKDVQFVQSPYPGTDTTPTGKEMVFTHASWPPQELIYDSAGVSGPGYYIQDKPFTLQPDQWATGAYPQACASFHGRLMMAGSQTDPLPGDPSGSGTETVWGTHVGDWNLFDPDTEVDPDDSIEFTSIYRSPIQWLYGQKDLLIGAADMEYIASADGIFQPADLGVFMHSVHGSIGVQPAGMGDRVLFAAEAGTKVRSMEFANEAQGWISPDMNVLHPTLFSAGIVRMIHIHTPHQMAVIIMGSGQVALLHLDPTIASQGWSRLNFNAPVIDAIQLPDDNGRDVLFFLIERTLNGVKTLVMESMPTWNDSARFTYMGSYSYFIPPDKTNHITGLEHLINERVQVIGDGQFLGTYVVAEDGSIDLFDQIGNPIEVDSAVVGLAMSARLTTLPLVTQDPMSHKRYTKIYVRTLSSLRPLINGERPSDRDPSTRQNQSQYLDILRDNEVAHLGTDALQAVDITEVIPYRLEVLGIYGSGTQNSVG